MRRFSLGVLLILSACDPTDVPRFSPDGSRAAVLLNAGRDPKKDTIPFAVLDVEKKTWKTWELPERWSADGLLWAGPRLLIEASRPKAEPPAEKGKPTHDTRFWVLDPASGTFQGTDLKPFSLAPTFTGTWQGRLCLFLHDPEEEKTRILSVTELKLVDALPFEVQGAGDGWLVRAHEKGGVDLLDGNGKMLRSIPAEEIEKACHRQARKPVCARVSSDGRHLLLGFDTDTVFRQAATEYTYGVFSVADGRLAWKGGSNNLRGMPVMTGDAVYALEAKSRAIHTGERTAGSMFGSAPKSEATSEVVLARHSAAGRTVVLDVPLKAPDKATRYSVSADGRRFILLVEGPAPRVLVIPVGEAVKAEDVRAF